MITAKLTATEGGAMFQMLDCEATFCVGDGNLWEYAKSTYGVDYDLHTISGEIEDVEYLIGRVRRLIITYDKTDSNI